MPTPQAYLLTWTCYGTWLHGDERGSVDDEHSRYGWPVVQADSAYQHSSSRLLAHAPTLLDGAMRRLVHDTIEAHAAHRGWHLDTLNVRTNHVHVVADLFRADPGKAIGELKAWSTRRLREAGLITAEQRVWTRQGSTRYLWTPFSIQRAIEYVRDEQGPALG